jgi:hypothetical protein
MDFLGYGVSGRQDFDWPGDNTLLSDAGCWMEVRSVAMGFAPLPGYALNGCREVASWTANGLEAVCQNDGGCERTEPIAVNHDRGQRLPAGEVLRPSS